MICFYTDSFCLILLSCIDLLKSLIFCLKTFFEELLILNWTHCFTLILRRIEANWTCRSCLFDLSLYFWYGLLKYCSLISSRAVQNCDSGPSKSATLPQEVKTVTIPLGSQRNISLRNTSTSEFLFVLWDPYSGDSAVRSWAKQPTFKALRVDLKIPQQVQFGKTYSYSLKTTPALTGTCALWRFGEGQPYKVASPVLKNGRASGRLTWLWTPTSNPTPMTLTAVCSSGKYKGEDIELTQGYKQ
jgi:hypothetical protein